MTMQRIDLETTITEHPWASVAVALGIGAGLALRPRSSLARALISTVVGTTFAVLRELAADRVATHAKSWLDDRVRPHATS
jgi:hypothetical protein